MMSHNTPVPIIKNPSLKFKSIVMIPIIVNNTGKITEKMIDFMLILLKFMLSQSIKQLSSLISSYNKNIPENNIERILI